MKFHVVTLFPEMIASALEYGVVGQALKSKILSVETVNPRSFTSNVHHTVDDRPFGGGDGMVMIPDPLASAVESVRASMASGEQMRVIHLSPRGRTLTDAKVRELSKFDNLVLISSRYGGIDQRYLNRYVDEEISIGDYVLSGGELAALVLIDAVGRQLPGVLGNELSREIESFSGDAGLLEHPQFTRPREWSGSVVPEVLLSGDHAKIARAQLALSILTTLERRPEILAVDARIQAVGRKGFEDALALTESLSDLEWAACGFKDRITLREKLDPILQSLPDTRKRKRRPTGGADS